MPVAVVADLGGHDPHPASFVSGVSNFRFHAVSVVGLFIHSFMPIMTI